MKEELAHLPQLAKDKHKENKKYFAKLRKKPPKNLDHVMRELHDEVFSEVDCLECANCCKTTGPLFTDADIERIARHLKLKPRQFTDRYLRMDEDQDYVLQSVPCAFLGADNYCLIYDVRPKACREYPHTDRKKFHQITDITLKNTAICPAAFRVVEAMKKRLG
ncbi:YkgJ family cysteine cluster protein [Sinomicrobium soli]|uniref:YkgJ family cysteine cluster protein n=1 Tax=Sinomicrobium sp. N-1-3-6 TaxID=2219864 RepID=UPI000DCE63A0|nr:YkgJ family cysteine cluster protein [Sinomicrobium sp. N-1-3-6]RAV31060.1 YkgJ family cysteine cluster protein [Sinomicrobium sp. N-1-3-6]